MNSKKELSAQLTEYAKVALVELDWESVRSYADAAARLDASNEWAERYKKAALYAMPLALNKVTLHEEIEAVLEDASPVGLNYAEIAKRVNDRDRYRRGDGKNVGPDQIRARVGKYHQKKTSKLQRMSGGIVGLKQDMSQL